MRPSVKSVGGSGNPPTGREDLAAFALVGEEVCGAAIYRIEESGELVETEHCTPVAVQTLLISADGGDLAEVVVNPFDCNGTAITATELDLEEDDYVYEVTLPVGTSVQVEVMPPTTGGEFLRFEWEGGSSLDNPVELEITSETETLTAFFGELVTFTVDYEVVDPRYPKLNHDHPQYGNDLPVNFVAHVMNGVNEQLIFPNGAAPPWSYDVPEGSTVQFTLDPVEAHLIPLEWEGSGEMAGPFQWRVESVVDEMAVIAKLRSSFHTADWGEENNEGGDGVISLNELMRAIVYFNVGGYRCYDEQVDAPDPPLDGFRPGTDQGLQECEQHDLDYNPQDWKVNISELLRLVQFHNVGGYEYCPEAGTEDGYCVVYAE